MTFNFKTIKKEHDFARYQKQLIDETIQFINTYEVQCKNLQKKLSFGLTDDNRSILINECIEKQLLDSFKDEIQLTYLTEIILIRHAYRQLSVNNNEQFIDFIEEFNKLIEWFPYFNILYTDNKKKFTQLQKKAFALFQDECKYEQLTSVFAGNVKEKEYFENTKKNFLPDNFENLFKVIQEIDREFIPYNIKDKFEFVYYLITFNREQDFNFILKCLEYIGDPYVLHRIISRYNEVLEFNIKLTMSDNIMLAAWGVCEIYAYFERVENEYISYIKKNIDNLINDSEENEILLFDKLLNERKKIIEEINKLLENTSKRILRKKENQERVKFIAAYIKVYFRLKKSDHRGKPYLLKSIDIFFHMLVYTLSEYLKNIDSFQLLNELLPFNNKNALFYGTISYKVSVDNKNKIVINKIFDKYISLFNENVFSQAHYTELGYEYSYQIEHMNGLLLIFVSKLNIDGIETIKKNIFFGLDTISCNLTDPIDKVYFMEKNNLSNLKNYVIFIIDLYIELLNSDKDTEDFDVKILDALDKILESEEFGPHETFSEQILWALIFAAAKKNKLFERYYYDKIDNLIKLLPCYVNSIEIKDEIYNRVTKYFEYDLLDSHFNELLNIYWSIYSSRNYEKDLEKVYNSIHGRTKEEITSIHYIRINKDIPDVRTIVSFIKDSWNSLHFYHRSNYLKYWIYYFDEKGMKDKANLLTQLNSLLKIEN